MSLTVALVIAALAVLVAIAAHGWWSARRATPRQPTGLVLPEPMQRVEPTLGPLPTINAAGTAVAPVPARRGARIDALIDAIAMLAVEAPVTGETVLAHLPPSRRAGGKPMLVEGLNAESGEWEPPAAGARYGELQAAVQLANRSGALNEIEYSEFVQKTQALADAIGAVPDFPDMLDVVVRARELDAFASPHDANLTVHLQANSVAWSVGYLRQCAERQGFVPGALPGRLVLPAQEEGAPPVLTLTFDAQAALSDDAQLAPVRRLTISLDVAQTPEAAEPFAAWQQAIRALADDMDASVVDDEGRPITLMHYTTIADELKLLYSALESRDMAAGSAAARRLFQ
ncbi:MAG: cell division protein FtsZ [Aquincola sp.]|nr:cell division protein FtsZ [Aquincola sp.]MDH4288502.1 cell division protein FtsZ [Aquincola sp.]MDH5329588.1 cell division protein FtsZ [Aquincola sp.]